MDYLVSEPLLVVSLCVFSCWLFPSYLGLSQVCVRPLNLGSLPVYLYLSGNSVKRVDSDPGLFAFETR